MLRHNLRSHARIFLANKCRIWVPGRHPIDAHTRDLSLCGMFAVTGPDRVGDGSCLVELRHRWKNQPLAMAISCRLVHRQADGVGLQFVEMDHSSHALLQTLLLYESGDPLALGRQFVNECPCSIPAEDRLSPRSRHSPAALIPG